MNVPCDYVQDGRLIFTERLIDHRNVVFLEQLSVFLVLPVHYARLFAIIGALRLRRATVITTIDVLLLPDKGVPESNYKLLQLLAIRWR